MFPALAAIGVVIILTSPFYAWPFSWLSDSAFARFCMFWALSVCIVLAFINQRYRPAAISIISVVVSLIIGALFTWIYISFTAEADAIPETVLSCLSGSILGALAGTWLIYVLEVYQGK